MQQKAGPSIFLLIYVAIYLDSGKPHADFKVSTEKFSTLNEAQSHAKEVKEFALANINRRSWKFSYAVSLAKVLNPSSKYEAISKDAKEASGEKLKTLVENYLNQKFDRLERVYKMSYKSSRFDCTESLHRQYALATIPAIERDLNVELRQFSDFYDKNEMRELVDTYIFNWLCSNHAGDADVAGAGA